MSRALVLGGGGVTGVAWETGMLLGLERRGLALREADLIVGTSAGSVVAAQVGGPTPLGQLYAAQVDGWGGELASRLGFGGILRLMLALRFTRDERKALARVGRAALRTRTPDEVTRRAVIESRLPVHTWPERALKIPAIDAATGELRVFDRASGVSLVDAVGASCAVPMVWPPVTIGSARYIDGGIRSVANVDLAAGHERIVVITPGTQGLRPGTSPRDQLDALQPLASTIVSPDAEARAAMGPNALDPAFRAGAAEAGLAQADRVADEVRAVWG